MTKIEKRNAKKYTKLLSPEERGEFLIKLYTEYETNYKTLACMFDCTVLEIIDYLKLVDIKKCTQCKLIKTYSEFHIATGKTDGYQNHCKECAHKKRKNYYDNGPMEQRIKSRQWKDENRDRVNFVENIRRKKPEVRQKAANYVRNRANSNPKIRLRMRFSNLLYQCLINHNTSKTGGKWQEIVGYSLQELINHLESKFQSGMNWDNYGSVWHVDHKVADTLFNYTSYNDESFKKCWSLKNLQPLFVNDNLKKNDIISLEWDNVELAKELLG